MGLFQWPEDWPSFDDIQIPANPEQWLKDRVIDILNYLGYEWPKTNENTLDAWSEQWSAYATTASQQVTELERSVATISSNNQGPVPDAVVSYFNSGESNLESLRSWERAVPAVANAYSLTADLIRVLRAVVIGKILLDAISLVAAIISGGSSAAVTVLIRTGASAGINFIIDQTIQELLGGAA